MTGKSKDIDQFYLQDYEYIMSSGLVGKLWRHIHHSLDRPFKGISNLRIIEIGTGNGQHFNLTRINTLEYVELDLREATNSNLDLSKAKLLGRRFINGDAVDLSDLGDEVFDGLIATCLLAHLSNLDLALENWRRVVRPGGTLSIYIPNEPGILLRISRHFSTKRRISKRGYNHEYIHWREHRNHFPAMRSSINHVFLGDEIISRNFPFRFLPWDLGLYTLITIKKSS
jgi:SAM-dependent methyltransferase